MKKLLPNNLLSVNKRFAKLGGAAFLLTTLTGCSDAGDFLPNFVEKLGLNGPTFLVQLCAFIVMAVVVIKLAYKPVAKFIEKRKEYIENNLKEAALKNEEASKNLEETRVNLQGSKKEAVQIIADAKKEAEVQREQILEETRKDVAIKHAKAQEDIKLEQEKALKELHDDVVDLALEATKSILNREVNSKDDKALLDSFVDDLMENK